jgi:mRNA interferase MazF
MYFTRWVEWSVTNISRGDIYFVELDPVIGKEQSGYRPALVISSDKINNKPLVITVVLGTNGNKVLNDPPSNVRLSPEESGLPNETVFLCFQIRSLDSIRFKKYVNRVSDQVIFKIEEAVRYSLGLELY